MNEVRSEIWKDIEGYEGKYQVSNFGRVKSLNYRRKGIENILPGQTDKYGYIMVSLYNDGKKEMFKVHRLVAQAFLPNEENKPFIDHINTIRNDNRIENLRWVTPEENNLNPITREHSKETRACESFRKRQADLQNKTWSKPGYRDLQSSIQKKKWEDPEYRVKQQERIRKQKSKAVIQIDKNTGDIIKEWSSATEVEEALGITGTNITSCCKKRPHFNTAGGYRWEYKEKGVA